MTQCIALPFQTFLLSLHQTACFLLIFINLVFCSPSLSQWPCRLQHRPKHPSQISEEPTSICTHSGSQLQHQPINGKVIDNNSENIVLFHQIFSSCFLFSHMTQCQTNISWMSSSSCFGDKLEKLGGEGLDVCEWKQWVDKRWWRWSFQSRV